VPAVVAAKLASHESCSLSCRVRAFESVPISGVEELGVLMRQEPRPARRLGQAHAVLEGNHARG